MEIALFEREVELIFLNDTILFFEILLALVFDICWRVEKRLICDEWSDSTPFVLQMPFITPTVFYNPTFCL